MLSYWIIHYLPWFISCISIFHLIITGNKYKNSWLIGLGNQLFWLTWILVSGTWGLLPMNIAIWVVYTRNHFKWVKEAEDKLLTIDDFDLAFDDAFNTEEDKEILLVEVYDDNTKQTCYGIGWTQESALEQALEIMGIPKDQYDTYLSHSYVRLTVDERKLK